LHAGQRRRSRPTAGRADQGEKKKSPAVRLSSDTLRSVIRLAASMSRRRCSSPIRKRPPPPNLRSYSQYGLTRAEATVALELLRCDGMPAVAERLGVLVGTARTHLHRVLAKTGTRGQADLVRLVLASRHGVRRDRNGR
jgi:DNA-binding CsgD family transcriptional regulator